MTFETIFGNRLLNALIIGGTLLFLGVWGFVRDELKKKHKDK